MSRARRHPWPWEGQPDPLAGVQPLDLSRVVALPDGAQSAAPDSVGAGEMPGVRDTMLELQGSLRRSGCDPDWSERKARSVAQRFDAKHRS